MPHHRTLIPLCTIGVALLAGCTHSSDSVQVATKQSVRPTLTGTSNVSTHASSHRTSDPLHDSPITSVEAVNAATSLVDNVFDPTAPGSTLHAYPETKVYTEHHSGPHGEGYMQWSLDSKGPAVIRTPTGTRRISGSETGEVEYHDGVSVTTITHDGLTTKTTRRNNGDGMDTVTVTKTSASLDSSP